MLNNNIAVVMCGHGSSFNLYEEDFKKNFQIIKRKIRANSYFCFIEKSEPNIENCLKTIKKKGIKKVFFFPFLLFNGEHFEKDIKTKVKKLSEGLKLEIELINKISLTKEVMPIIEKRISKMLKKDKTNILATFCSGSKNPNVYLESKKYTKILSKNLNIDRFFSYFVGEERKLIKELKEHKNNFLIIQPIFLFKGYLQKKNLNFFKELKFNNCHILNTLMTIDDIQNLVVKKLKSTFHITN